MMLVLLASLPILFTIVMMVSFNWSAKRVMPIAWGIALVLAAFVWRVPAQWLAGETIAGAGAAYLAEGMAVREWTE